MKQNANFIRRILSFVLIAALLAPCLPQKTRAVQVAGGNDDFVPVLRFVVASDVHIRNDADAITGHEQLAKLYKTAYAYCESHPVYNKLDAMFFIGDNTQGGSEQQQTYFFNYLKEHTKEGTYALATMGNHEFKATGQNYKDPEGATAKFLEHSGYETTDTRFELGGYQFIAFAPDRYEKSNNLFFTPEKLEWVKKELDAAVAATPDKPIFVLQHMPPSNTMKGSSGSSGDLGLKALLDNYPQVIDFSGHTHCSITDPRIIWQDTFTAINTGGLAYLSIPIMNGKNDQSGGRAIDEEGGWIGESEDSAVRNAGMYYIVEIDKNSTVRVLTYNMFTESLWGEPFIIDSQDPADFIYTDARRNEAVTPSFAEGAALQLRTNNYKNLQFAIPQASCKDVVQSYRVEVYQGSSLKQTLYRSSMINYGEAAPAFVNAYVKNLKPNTNYTIKVYATSSYNIDSAPLTMNVTTSVETTAAKADVLDVAFLEDGTAINAVSGDPLTTYGTPTVTYDKDQGKYIASFDGVDDTYGFWGISNWYDVISTSYTLETYAYLEKTPTSGSMGILANLQSASIGFVYKSDGKVHFYNRLSSAYTTPAVAVEAGSWVHIAGTYDGETIKYYINGQLVAEKAIVGTLVTPAYLARCMYLGADCNVNTRESYFQGKIATAKLYTQALTAEQIAEQFRATTEEDLTPFCPEHENTDTWTEITAQDWANGGALTTGHYVLTGDVFLSAPLTVAAGNNVCVNLAGHNITASGTTASGEWYRCFENYGTLTILDSAINDGIISGGTVWEQLEFAMGGNIYNGENAVFNLHGGIISGGKAAGTSGYEPGAIGGNIYGAAGSIINIKGGRVENGISTKNGSYTKSNELYGGNIGSDGTVNISGGVIADGKVSLSYTSGTSSRILYLYGGNIAVRSGGALNISGGIITGGTATGTRTNESTTSKSYGRGGNIYVYGSDMTISGGIISDGKIEITVIGTATGSTVPATTNAFGANIYIAQGDFTMTGGTISGGIVNSVAKASDASTSTGKAQVVGYGGNIYITDGVTANISDGTITGGQIIHNSNSASTEGYGGNIYVNGGAVLNMSGGTVSDGYVYYRGGNIALKEGSTVNLSGNAIVSGGTARNNGDNIFLTGAGSTVTIAENVQIPESGSNYDIYTVTNAGLVMYGGRVEGDILIAGTASYPKGTFAMYGGYVGKLAKSDVIPTSAVNVYNGVLKNLPAWEAKAPCACYEIGEDGYTFWHKNANDGTCSACAYDYVTNKIVMEAGHHSFAVTGEGTAACHCGDSMTGVIAIENGNAYTNLADAFAENTAVTLIGNTRENVTITADGILDLNGYDVDGSITIAEGVNFFLKDTQTDDFTVADDNYGKVTGTITGAAAAEGYLQIAETDGISFHKVVYRIKAVNLRASCAGIYYTAEFQYDEVVAGKLAANGVALSTENITPVADDSDASSLYTTGGNSVLLSGIMKEENNASLNRINARQAIHTRAYLKFTDGNYLYSETVSTSLKNVVETIDAKLWNDLSEAQKISVAQMYSIYSNEMAPWLIENIKKYLA